eukprot:jgi/Ulvmu1/2606/UM014_0057.1
MQSIIAMVLRAVLRLLNPVLALIDRLIPGVAGQETVLPAKDHITKTPSSSPQIEKAITDVAASCAAWATLDNATRADLLAACKKLFIDNYESISEDAIEFKGSYLGGVGDEMLQAVPALFYFDEFEDLMRNGPQKPIRQRKVGDQIVCDVFPRGLDNVVLAGGHGEVWMRPGKDSSQGAKLLGRGKAVPGICCVLAAGNYLCVALRDTLQQLVVNNNLCILKINPCNDWIGPAMATFMEPLVQAGALRIVYGPAAVAQVRPAHAFSTRPTCGQANVCSMKSTTAGGSGRG